MVSAPSSDPSGGHLSQWRAPDGWLHRRYDRAGAGRGWLLFQTGRADMIEKYQETLDHFSDRGWSVSAFDWRGQGGSGRLGNGDTGHIDSFTTLTRDLQAFWAQAPAGPGPRVIVAHSMGAFVTLSALAEQAIAPAAAVLVAPMLGVRSPLGAVLGEALARWMSGRGDPRRAAWARRTGPRADLMRQRRLTHDLQRFAEQERRRREQPELCLGSPSWHWIAQAFAATARLRADPRLANLEVPVQLLVAEHDRLVDPRAAAAVAARLPHSEVVRFGSEAAHEILREAEPVRGRALAAIDRFLDRVAPAP